MLLTSRMATNATRLPYTPASSQSVPKNGNITYTPTFLSTNDSANGIFFTIQNVHPEDTIEIRGVTICTNDNPLGSGPCLPAFVYGSRASAMFDVSTIAHSDSDWQLLTSVKFRHSSS
ncbi:hypothetical protein Pelo_16818 [Pelomyxa schiedti]|nr:hypothetical protein Pelo_16818 [Pelomyxa schiedti]